MSSTINKDNKSPAKRSSPLKYLHLAGLLYVAKSLSFALEKYIGFRLERKRCIRKRA